LARGRVAFSLSSLLSLREMLAAEDETATAQRLGFVLEKLRRENLARVVDAWLPARRPLIPLATSAPRPAAGPVSARWRIVDNSAEFDSWTR
jgi:hypothetical protein